MNFNLLWKHSFAVVNIIRYLSIFIYFFFLLALNQHWILIFNKKLVYINNTLEEQKQPPDVLYKKAVLKNFTIFTGKHLYWSLFLIRPATLLKWYSNTGVFLLICEIFKNNRFEEHLKMSASGGISKTNRVWNFSILLSILNLLLDCRQMSSREVNREHWFEMG